MKNIKSLNNEIKELLLAFKKGDCSIEETLVIQERIIRDLSIISKSKKETEIAELLTSEIKAIFQKLIKIKNLENTLEVERNLNQSLRQDFIKIIY